MSGLAGVLSPDAVGASEDLPVRWAESTRVVAVGWPANERGAAEAMLWAGAEGVTAVPVGTGRHVHRVVRADRCVLLSSRRMAGIRIYEPADLTLTAGAGTTIAELHDTLAPHDQWLPFDPPDAAGRTLGGAVAAGLSGPLATGYGALRNHVLGGTVVLGDGRIVRLGGRVVKNVAGFDLLRPLVGSLGGLGMLTEVCVRLFPVPQTDRLLVTRADAASALVGAARAVARAPIVPASCVLVAGVEALGQGAALVLRLHGARAAVDADQRTLERVIERPLEVLHGESAEDVLRVVRDHPDASPAGDTPRDVGVGAASVPSERLGNLLSALDASLGPVPFAGDVFAGRVRFVFGPDQRTDVAAVRRAVEVLGGSLGIERVPERWSGDVGDAVSLPTPAEAALQERVRSVFDPNGVLWRGAEARRSRARAARTAGAQ